MNSLNIDIIEKSFSKNIFRNTQYTFTSNNCYTLIGLNGSGKSTLIETIIGFDSNFKGEITYTNKCISSNTFYIPADFHLPNYLTARQYFEYLSKIYKTQNSELFGHLINIFELDDFVDNLLESYSYGMKKKIQFICGICMDKEIYIFDEITSGLDIGTTLLIEQIIKIKKQNKIFIIATHDYDFAKSCSDKTLLIYNNNLIELTTNIRQELIKLGVLDDKLSKIKSTFINS